MPQLVKGGKHVYGWTTLKNDGRIRIPDEAYDEYQFKTGEKIILMSGSKTSGGFSIHTPEAIESSKIGQHILESIGFIRESRSFTAHRQSIIESGGRFNCWTTCDSLKSFHLSKEFINVHDLKTGSKLLTGRGSGLGLAYIARGPIFNEALKHEYLPEYE